MDKSELMSDLRSMFDMSPSPSTLKDLQAGFLEGGDKMVTQEALREACEALVADGMLTRTGEDTYATSDAYLEAEESQFQEDVSHLYAEHVIKKAAKK